MMKTWVRFTLIGAVSVAVLGGTTFGVQRWAYSKGVKEVKEGGPSALEKGLGHLKLAHALWNRSAAYEIAKYHYGTRNYSSTFEWFQKAADQGDVHAYFGLGGLYFSGQGVSRDYSEGVKWYQKAADQGSAMAQWQLGLAYFKGQGVLQNFSEGAKWFQKAADQGNRFAQNDLGMAYRRGDGVLKNPIEAAKWFQKAAEEDVDGACNLGVLYENGEGVPKDPMEAKKWYRNAADRGSARGQMLLGLLYFGGKDFPRDPIEAKKWFQLAADQGDADAKTMLAMYKTTAAPQESPVEVQGLSVVDDAGYPKIRGIVRNIGSRPVDALVQMELVRADGIVVEQYEKSFSQIAPGNGQLINIAIAPYYANAYVRLRNVKFR